MRSSADRVVVARGQFVAVGVVGGKAHAVGVERQLLALVEDQVGLSVEGDLVLAQQSDATRAADAFKRGGDLVGIDRIRVLALEAEQHRLVGAVAAAGHRQRAVQLGAHAGDPIQHAFLFQPVFGETRGGAHRPHRVRGGRPDADLEQVEYADGHGCTAGDAGETAILRGTHGFGSPFANACPT